MLLVKYQKACRVQDIRTGTIRLSQPSVLNDPQEALPRLSRIVSKELLDKYESLEDLLALGQDAAIESMLASEQFRGRSRSEVRDYFWKSIPPMKDFLSDLIPLLNEGVLGEYLPEIGRILWQGVDNLFGIVSLADSPSLVHMWTQYGDEHRGVALVLDLSKYSPLVNDSGSRIGVVRPVQYFEEKPALSFDEVLSGDFFFHKAASYSYEKEWRLVLPFDQAVLSEPGSNVFLLSYPKDRLHYVVLGALSTVATREEVLGILDTDESFAFTSVVKARITADSYKLELDVVSRFREADKQEIGALLGATNRSIDWLLQHLPVLGIPSVVALRKIVSGFRRILELEGKEPLLVNDLTRRVSEIELSGDICSVEGHVIMLLYSGELWVDLCRRYSKPDDALMESPFKQRVRQAASRIDLEALGKILMDLGPTNEGVTVADELDRQVGSITTVQHPEVAYSLAFKAACLVASRMLQSGEKLLVPRSICKCPNCGGVLQIRRLDPDGELPGEHAVSCYQMSHDVRVEVDNESPIAAMVSLFSQLEILHSLNIPFEGALSDENRRVVHEYFAPKNEAEDGDN